MQAGEDQVRYEDVGNPHQPIGLYKCRVLSGPSQGIMARQI